MSNEDKTLAQRFHDLYEQRAPIFCYSTRPDTKEFDPNSPNGKLMQNVCETIVDQEVKACAAIKDAEIAEARKTAEYWKAEHLAGNKEIAARDLMIKELREALTLNREELDKLPHSLGYDFTHLPKIDAALAKSEHHNSRALEKMLLEAELKGLSTPDFEFVERHNAIKAKLAELNKE